MEFKIELRTIDTIKHFVNICTNLFSGTVDVRSCDSHYIVDGSSIIGLISLDLSKPVIASLNTSNDMESKTFEAVMKQFSVD